VRDRRNHCGGPERPANYHDACPRADKERQHHYASAAGTSPAPAPQPPSPASSSSPPGSR